MASSRTRSALPADATEEASLAPWVPAQSLAELKDAMGSPGVIQAEVDALLAAIARPPAEDETPRARADFLLALMDLPEEARDRTGSDGRTVRGAAVEALLELGYPYALEVHPDVFEEVRQQAGGRGHGARGGGSKVGVAVTLLSIVVQVLLLLVVSSVGRAGEALQLFSMAAVVVPPVLAIFGHLLEFPRLRSWGATGMALQGLAWLLFSGVAALESSSGGLMLLVVIPWYLPLTAAYLMRAKSEPEDAAPVSTALPTEPP
jgi:hypothetical protein